MDECKYQENLLFVVENFHEKTVLKLTSKDYKDKFAIRDGSIITYRYLLYRLSIAEVVGLKKEKSKTQHRTRLF